MHTTTQAAAQLGVSRFTVRRLALRIGLIAPRVGRAAVFTHADIAVLAAALEARRGGAS